MSIHGFFNTEFTEETEFHREGFFNTEYTEETEFHRVFLREKGSWVEKKLNREKREIWV